MIVEKTERAARLGTFSTPHGAVRTPAFMNVATAGAIKGALSAYDLTELKCPIMLCNTYHLHVRPGEALVREMGGLHGFTGWAGPILTDSGGFQVFSLAGLRKITEEGVTFASHVDGRRLFIGPEESMRIQSALASTIAMAFDECVENPADYEYVRDSCARTVRWLHRCREELARLNALDGTLNPRQLLFGINQGGTYDDLRAENMREIAGLGLDGYAVGGLAVGEPAEVMYHILDTVVPLMPVDRPRYLMGVGTPVNILEAVHRGIDFFDCVMPARNARHAHVFTWQGRRNLLNEKYAADPQPLDPECGCPVCAPRPDGRPRHSRAYIRHLFKSGEMLAMRLCVTHNLFFYNTLMERIRGALDAGAFDAFYKKFTPVLDRRV